MSETQSRPTGELMTRAQRTRLVVLLGSLIALTPLTIDMYLPALPAITADFATSAASVAAHADRHVAGLALGQRSSGRCRTRSAGGFR